MNYVTRIVNRREPITEDAVQCCAMRSVRGVPLIVMCTDERIREKLELKNLMLIQH